MRNRMPHTMSDQHESQKEREDRDRANCASWIYYWFSVIITIAIVTTKLAALVWPGQTGGAGTGVLLFCFLLLPISFATGALDNCGQEGVSEGVTPVRTVANILAILLATALAFK